MRKAKIALTVVALGGLVGSSLALKLSKEFIMIIYKQKFVGNTTYCTEPYAIAATTFPGLGVLITTYASTRPTTTVCPLIELYLNE